MRSIRTALVVTLSGAAAAVAVPAGSAAAASGPAAQPLGHTLAESLPDSPLAPTRYVTGALGDSIAPVKNLTLDPLSTTGVDPLDNAVGSQVADFKPLSTAAVTGPVTRGGSLATLPVVGTVTSLLPG